MAGKQPFLPMSQTDAQGATSAGGMRRRLSSLSLHLKIQSSSISAATWGGLRRSKSAAAMGDHAVSSIRKWWEWGWAWIQFRKPVSFGAESDLEVSEGRGGGYNSKVDSPLSSFKNVLHKVRKEFRRLSAAGNDRVGLPQTYKYDSFNYAKNFQG